jgi:acyl-lipid omega-6 desaturase (Delta-12 desaturase)
MLHNILLHTAHHADPRVPLTELPTAQSTLEQAYAGAITVVFVTPAYVWNLWRVCQLYDFERHCWLSYDGNATSEPIPVLNKKRTCLP